MFVVHEAVGGQQRDRRCEEEEEDQGAGAFQRASERNHKSNGEVPALVEDLVAMWNYQQGCYTSQVGDQVEDWVVVDNQEVRHWVHVWGQRWSVLLRDLERIVFSDQSDDGDLLEPLRNCR